MIIHVDLLAMFCLKLVASIRVSIGQHLMTGGRKVVELAKNNEKDLRHFPVTHYSRV